LEKIRLGSDEIGYMTVFESITKAGVLDCILEGNTLHFLIREGDMGLAIGKGGENIKRVQKAAKRGVRVIEYSKNPEEFIKNLFSPVEVKQVKLTEKNNKKHAEATVGKYDKRDALGGGGHKIKVAKKLANRHHNISGIQVKTG